MWVGEEVSVPAGFASTLSDATGLDVVVEPSVAGQESGSQARQADLFLGILPEGEVQAETAVVVGEEDVCVLADRSWYSANKKTPPVDKAALSDEHLLSILRASDPLTSGQAAVNMPLWISALSGVTSEATGTEAAPPGEIASSLEALRAVNNLQTDVRYQVVEGTCVSVPTYLVELDPSARGGAARALSDYLTSPDGQDVLGAYALTYPVAGNADLPERPKAAKAFTAVEVEKATAAWNEAFGY